MPGGAELFFIVLVIIMLFGSKKIPELARGLGKGIREIKNATGDIQKEIREGARDINIVKDKVNVEKQVKDLIEGEKEKVAKSTSETSKSSEKIEKDSVANYQEQESSEPISQTIRRKNPYAKEEPENTSEEV